MHTHKSFYSTCNDTFCNLRSVRQNTFKRKLKGNLPHLKTIIERGPGRVLLDVVVVNDPEADPDVYYVAAHGLEEAWVTECCVAE